MLFLLPLQTDIKHFRGHNLALKQTAMFLETMKFKSSCIIIEPELRLLLGRVRFTTIIALGFTVQEYHYKVTYKTTFLFCFL